MVGRVRDLRPDMAVPASVDRELERGRGRRVMFAVSALLAAASLGGPMGARQAVAKNNIDPGRRTITIEVPIQLSGGTKELAKRWQEEIDRYWNKGADGKPLRYCGKQVRFRVNIEVLPEGEFPSDPDSYHIYVLLGRPGHSNLFAHSDVRWDLPPGTSGPVDPTAHSASGSWHEETPDGMIAHEFGHLLGLSDEYTWVGKDHWRPRAPRDQTFPDPQKAPEYEWRDADKDGEMEPGEVVLKHGAPPSRMAEPGQVLPRHLREVMRKHKVPCQMAAEIEWGFRGSYQDAAATGHLEMRLRVAGPLAEDESGLLTGTIAGQWFSDGRGAGSGCNVSAGDDAPLVYDVTLRQTDDAIEIVEVVPAPDNDPADFQWSVICPGLAFEGISPDYGLLQLAGAKLEPRGEEYVYEFQQSWPLGEGGTAEYWLTVVVRPVEEAPAVG